MSPDLSDHGDENDNDEDSRIKLVLKHLPGSVSKQRASELLLSIAASMNILFWTIRCEILHNERQVPGTYTQGF